MPRYTVDPVTGERTKVAGTNYVPPCIVKTEERKAAKAEKPAAESPKEVTETK